MAFDLDGYLKDAEVRREERQAAEEAKARQEAEDAKPWYEKLWGAASDFGDDLVDTMKERGEKFADAYGNYIRAEAEAKLQAHEAGDHSGAYDDTSALHESAAALLSSGIDLVTTPVRVAAYHATAPIRERVGAFLEQEANEGSEFAQDLRSTEAFVNYFMTPEEKLKKAREIEANTGISADSFMDDDLAYKEALKINDFTNKRKAAMQENFSMETVWQEFPELREVAKMSPRDAAIALHDIESVRQTHGIVEAFTHFLAVGEKQLELDNIGAKIMMGTANENDHARAAELEKMLEEDKKKNLPSFFDDPLSAIAGGVASSAPEMLDSIREGGAWAWAGMIASGAAGTAVEPGGGTAVLGAVGGGVGFLRGIFGAVARREGARAAIRTMFGAAARREAGQTALQSATKWGAGSGMFYGIARPEAGRRFLEYSEMTDTDGNPLMTDAEAKNRAALGGALNAGIELWNVGMFLKPLTRFAGKAGAQGIEKAAIEGIVNRAKYDLGKRESVAVFAKDQVKDVLKIAATETAEESAQSVSDDLIHNYIVASADGRAAESYYSFADITAHAAIAGAEAVPAALGFGLAGGSLHLPGGAIRHAHRLSSEKTQEDRAVQTTVTGTVMLGRLQQVASSAKLKETAPDVQRKLIRAQVRGTGFENVYIDAAAALEKESGLADLKAVAKAAELLDAAVENAVQHGGYLFVPIEKYAQSEASPALLEAVSFAPEADSLARIKKNAKDLSDAVEEAQKKAVKTRIDISQTIAHEWFPEAPQHASEEVKARRKAEYEAAMSAITMNPTNPKQGWRLLHGGFIAERAALLQPATEALERDVKNGSAAWVEDFKKEHGHAPTQEDMLTLAYRLMVGDAAAPKVEGWQTLTQEEMDSTKGQLDALNDRIRTMEDIESRMKEVDGSEIRMASGLSPEAYSVYRQLMANLKAIGGVQSRAARLNALLFARHADQYARVMREKNWEKDYTALDYYRDTFAVEHGERAQAGGFTQAGDVKTAEERLVEDEAAWSKIVDDYEKGTVNATKSYTIMDTPLVLQLVGVPHLPLKIDGRKIEHILEHDGMNTMILRELPRAIADPLMVFDTYAERKVVVVDLKDANGATIIVPIDIRQERDRLDVNILNNAYGKNPRAKRGDGTWEQLKGTDFDWFIKQNIEKSRVLYMNTKKSAMWAQSEEGDSLNKGDTQDALSAFIVSNAFQNVKTENDLEAARKEHPGFYQLAGNDVLAAQKEAVRKQYAGSALWMKAPNGVQTNLTEEEWLTVRTPAFKAWFGDWEHDAANASKVVDANGEPLVVYHGTPIGGFDTFKRQQNYFTSMKWYADRYQDESASSNYVPAKNENLGRKMTYAVFLNIKKPFDTRNKRERTIFEKEFYRQWGCGAPLSDKGLPDWTDGDDLQEFFEEKEYDYDGLILDEGGIPDNNGGVISRGISYVSFEPNQIKSVDNSGVFSVEDMNIFKQEKGNDVLAAQKEAVQEHPRFYQRAWHGSPYDFDAFLNRMIGVGEGAQAHGWGLYFAKDKTISDRYKENLKKSHKTLHTLTYDGKTMDELPSSIQNVMQSMENAFNNIFAHGYSDALATLRKAYEHDERIWQERLAEFERPIALYEENPKASVRMLRESTPQYSNARNTIDAAKSAVEGKRRTAADVVRTLKEAREIYVERIRDVQQNIRDIDEVDANKFHLEVKEPIGKLFEVEIPDDDVLLDEQKTFDEQPSLVQKKLERMFSHIDKASILYRLSRKDVRYEEVYGDYCEFLDLTDPSDMGIHEEEAYVRELKERVDAELKELLGGESLERAFLRSLGTGQEIYRTVGDMLFPHRETDEAISRALNAQGIKGITYDGRRDGRCYVVFDEKAIDIVAKFNQEKGSDVLAAQKEAVRRQYAGSALWMKAPNGVQTNLTEEQWLTVRTPAFKAWFGDWEQVAEATPKINVQNIQEVKEVLHKLGNKPIENKATGIVASVSKRGRGKMVSSDAQRHSLKNGYTSEEHLLAAANVEQLFQNAILSETHEDRNGELASVKLFSSLVMLNKKPAIACFTVKETTNAGHKIYSVQMLELKKSAGNLPRSAVKRSSATADLSAISIAELADKYNPLLERVDENGEPMASSLAQNFSQEEKRTSQGEIAMQPDGKRLIRLFRTADESTFLHEMGHLFLMDLDVLAKIDDVSAKDLATVNEWAAWKEGAAKEYADTDWADEFRDHEAAILAALASGDALRIARAKEVWRHERFARGFELYLREGKAPSVGLRGVFRKFRMFLRKVYSFVQSLGGRPSLAVEAVMARMIAAEEEIQAALLDERYRPVEKLGGEETLRDLMGEDMAKLYAKWLQEAQEESEDLLRAQVMKDLKREAREAYEEEVAKEREKKRAELEKEPVYLAEAALEKSGKAGEAILGHWYDSLEEYKEERAKRKSLETELTEYIEAYARDLDKKMLAEHLTEENIEKAMTSPKAFGRRRALEAAAMRRKERLMAYIGGEVAEAKKEVEEHLSAMKEDADETAKKKLQAALERLKGSAKWSGEEYAEIEEIARAKTQEEQKKKYEAFKAKHKERAKERVRKQAEEKRRRKDFEEEAWANERFFREQARLFLASLPISESCNPEFFRRKEKQHARAAAKAAAQRKWDKARAERENQAHAAACAYEATRMREEMQKLTADVQKKLGARTVRIQATERYWLHHLAYLLGLKKSDVEKPEGALDLAELFDSYKDNLDLDADAPTEILELLAREETSYKSMTLGQLRQTVNMLRALYTIGRDKNRVLSFAGKDFADVAQEILSSKTRLAPEGVKQHPVSPDTGGVGYSDWLAKAPGIGEQMALLAQKGMLNLMKPEVMIRLLGEEAHSYIYGTIERAQMKETKLLGESQDELLRIFSVYTKEERMTWKDRTIKAGGEKLTKENVLCLALNWGSEINRKRILDGIGQKLDVEAILAEHVTEKDWKVVQEVWDFIDTFWKETAAVEEKLNGSRLGKVPAAPFSIRTVDGAEIKLRGGYYPLKYNAEKSTQAKEHAAEEEAKRGAAGAKVLGAHRGHTKRRSEGEVKEPVLLEFDVLNGHVYDAAHNIAFRIAARDVHRILRQKDFKQYVASTYGLAFWNRLDQWALDVWAVAADGSDLAATALSRTMAAFRCNSTMAIMGYRLWPVIENATNIGPMMDKLGAVEAHAAVADYYGNKKSMDALLEKSLFMMNRINNMERDLRQDTHIFAPTYAPIEFLRDNAYWALAQTDLMLSKPLWCRAYKNAFAKALAAVNRENAENRRTYQEAQEEVERLRAEVYDLRKELFGLEEESKERRYMNPAQLKGSPYAGMSEREIEDEKKRRNEELKEKERAFYEAGHRLERAAALPIREGAELIEEAEMRSVQAADGAVRDVIGSGQTKDLSALQRSRNEAVKMFTSFYSYFNTQFNALLESHFKGKYSEEGASRVDVWMPLARSLIYRIVLVSILGAMGKFALGLEGDDDRAKYRTVKDPKTGEKKKVEVPKEERFLRVLGKNLLSTTTGTMPFFRDFAGMVASKVFDGTTYGRNFELGSVVTRGLKQAQATMELIEKKGEQDLAREEKAAEERRKMQKMTPRRRRQYENDKKYKKPKKEIGYIDVMKSGAQTISTLTAARTGVTNTIADGMFTVLQYMTDSMEKDPYYDRSMENVLRSVLFDKKLRAKEPPEKPKKHKDKRHRRGAR